MSDTTALDAAKIAIRIATRDQGARALYGARVLYVPSVLDEAAELLSKLFAAGQEHRIEPEDWANVTSLPQGVLDALASRYCSRVQVTHAELHAARDALVAELTGRGLTVRPGQRIAVDPPAADPRSGHGQQQKPVALSLSSGGWDIRVDEPFGGPPHSIAAPATEDGASEVAELVHKILSGEAPDPFAAPAPKEARA
ncbi:hypothetical protein [Streptomyces omiyaensis]|uniref:hypothetical protein n=1 Tax=Streptomyces omiyaensis TaxID=68247 RepID=UPI0036F62424